ncbi:MAG: sulfatase-like hydrolase/transferase [Candidatus Aminicenantes bacterium]|jgi:arylsulfatase A-like enzyme/predicted Zn-dependent protease
MKKEKRNIIIAAIVLMIIIAAGLFFFTGDKWESKKKQLGQLNVILITIDTLRTDHVSAYGKGRANTPNLDRLAGEGVLFETCIAQVPYTLPSHTTILSGTYPLYHQVRDNAGFVVPERLNLVSEVLKKEKNMAASAFVSTYVLHSKWGLNQGFDSYSNVMNRPDSTDLEKLSLLERRADSVLKDAQQWIDKNKENHFFTWIHLYDPHTPYNPPSPFKEKFNADPYRGEVEYADEQLGHFFAFLKEKNLYDQSLIILTADHGEGLHDHGEPTHCYFVYDTTVWVPLIIRAPFQFPVKRVKSIVEHVDIAATIFDAFNIPIPNDCQGESLLPLMFKEKSRKKETAYTETYYTRLHYGWSELHAWYQDDFKYIQAPKPELYNLETDADEGQNLFLKKSYKSKNMKKTLDKFIRDQSKNALLPGNMKNFSRKDLKKLETLGYVTTFVDTRGKKNLADPKDKLEIYNAYLNTHDIMRQKRYDEAIEILEKIVADSPEIIDAYLNLVIVYKRKKMLNKALEIAYKVLEQKPDYYAVMVNIVGILTDLEDYEKAIEETNRFLKIFPEDHVLFSKLGLIYYYQNDLDTALVHLQQSVKLEEKSPFNLKKIGEIYILKEQYDKAEDYINRALALVPKLKGANYHLGQIEDARENYKKANDYYREEIRLNPGAYKACYNLAGNLKRAGDFNEAIEFYKKVIEIEPSFKMGYFMLANSYLEMGEEANYREAITLCQKGIALEPQDKETLFGYFIITNLYSRLGDQQNLSLYTKRGEQLNLTLQGEMGN